MTSSKHPTAQQSICATSKTDLIYWDTLHEQHGQPGQHEPWQPFWWEATSLVRHFAVSCPETRPAVPMHESLSLRQTVSLWNTVSIPWLLHQLQTLVSDRKHGNSRTIRSIETIAQPNPKRSAGSACPSGREFGPMLLTKHHSNDILPDWRMFFEWYFSVHTIWDVCVYIYISWSDVNKKLPGWNDPVCHNIFSILMSSMNSHWF
jgi:hypothetical protein